jgi:hypothetical protein
MWNIVDLVVGNRTYNIIIYETKGKPTLKASTFAIRTSQRTDQKLQKSLLCQRSQKLFLKNLPTLQKIKISPTHSPTNTAENDTEPQY